MIPKGWFLLLPGLFGFLMAACSAGPGPVGRVAADLPVLDVPHLEERSLLLLLSERRVYESFTAEKSLAGPVDLRRDLALTVGRVGDPRGLGMLRALLIDEEATVREAAVFALGVLGDRGAVPDLLHQAGEESRVEGGLAVEALGKLEVELLTVLAALAPLPEGEIQARLLPHLWRFREGRFRGGDEATADLVLRVASRSLAIDDRELHARAAYALTRAPRAEALPILRRLTADPDPRVRAWTARALGRVGGREEMPLLLPLLGDPEPGPVIEALRAGHRFVLTGLVAAPESWRQPLLALLRDPRPGVRLTALEVAGAWLLDEELEGRLVAFWSGGERRERELALLALAAGRHPRAVDLAAEAAVDPDPVLRTRAATAAGALASTGTAGAVKILEALLGDPVPGVRIAARKAWLALGMEGRGDMLTRALDDPDAAARAAALSDLADTPALPFELLAAALERSRRDRLPEARLAAVEALVARGEGEPLERGSVVRILERLTEDPDYLLRRAAGDGLRQLDRPAPDPGSLQPIRGGEVYRQIVQRTRRERTVEIRTSRGAIRVRLACPEVPLTCLNFLQLTAQGFYDGLPFHRVIPDFVVQGGDPRGDGYGGPGYQIRDEISTLRFDRGVIGMAHSEPDTAGSQFFITLSPQPHLDGTCTAFGRVVAGEEVLDRLIQGDVIETLVEVD